MLHRTQILAFPPRVTVAKCLHDTLTLDQDLALLGLNYPNKQDAAFDATRSLCSLTPDQIEDVRQRAAEARQDKGPCLWNPDPEM